jgi:uncharacterized protein (TIGR03000 family)
MYYNPDTSADNRATIVVHLPANARLLVNGKLTRSTSETRRFVSPPLEAGKSYHYDFEARVERDGKVHSIPQRVEVRAGEKREISLIEREPSAARKPATTQPAEKKRLPEQRVRAD